MRSLATPIVFALTLAASAVPAVAQQVYFTDFEAAEIGTPAEQLSVPNVTFTSSPPQSWFVVDAAFLGQSGHVLQQPQTPGSLFISFPPVRSLFLTFAMNADPGQTSLLVQAYDGNTLVTQVTEPASGGSLYGEGAVLLSSQTPFRLVRISGVPASTLIAIDNLIAYDTEGCFPVAGTPTIVTSPATPVVAGRPFTLEWSPVADLGTDGTYTVETSFSSSFSPLDATFSTSGTSAVIPTPSSAAGRVLYTRVRAVRPCGQSGPNSPTVSFDVATAAASFSATAVSASLTTSVGVLPAPGSVTFRNVGGSAASLALAISGGFQLDRSSLSLGPGEQGTVAVSATSAQVATAGSVKGTLTATAVSKTVTVPVSLTVTGSATSDRTGTRVAPSLANVSFSAPAGQDPAPRTITLAVGPITGSGAVYLVPSVGPGGAWLDLSGDFTRPISTPGTVSLTLSVNRSARSAEDGVAPFRTLVKIKADGASDGDAAVIEVVDLEPAVVSPGAGTRGQAARAALWAPSWAARRPLAVTLPPGGTSFIVPSAVKAGGSGGAQFSSDGWLKNQGSTPVSADFYFTPDGKDGLSDPSVLRSTRTLPPGTTFRLSELLPSVFGVADTSGQVEIRSEDSSSLTLRTTVESVTGGDPASRYGTEIPTVSYGSGIGVGGGELVIPGVDDDAANRANLILTETTGNDATVDVTVTNDAGQQLGPKRTLSLKPYSKTQINGLVKEIAGTTLSGGWAGVTVTGGTGKVAAVATVIDNVSNSFSAVKGRAPGVTTTIAGRTAPLAPAAASATGASLVLPSAARLTGALNTKYTTTLSMVNGTATSAGLSLTYNYIDVEDGGKAKSVTKSVTLPPRGALPKAQGKDVVSDLFGIKVPSYGWMKVDGDVGRVVAVSAISALVDANDASKGVKTSQVDGVLTSSPDVMGKQELERRFSGAEKSVQRRTNVIFVEVTGQPCNVLLTLAGANGSPLAQKTVTVQGNQYLQINDVFGSNDPNGLALGDGPFQNVEVAARVLSGDGRVIGVATVIDNVSRNPEVFVLKPAGTPSPSISF